MIAKLRGRSVAELRDRLAQSARALAERRGFVPSIVLPADLVLTPRTPWPALDATAIGQRLSTGEHDGLLERAERVVSGVFDVLGLHGLSYGNPVQWQRDPLTGRSAELLHWSRVPYLNYARVGDHKLTWEVNRHQWLIMLGQAWQLTRDDRYALAASRLLSEWLDANPAKRGINWCSALELAFRVQSWIHGLRLFETAPSFTVALQSALIQSASLQVDHIAQNLSTWFSPNTHLTGEALAMLSAGTAWPQLPHAIKWREEGWRILSAELPKQVRDDGVYFEQSAWYQAYTVDFYVLGMAWARTAGLPIPLRMRERVLSAARALHAVTRPDGTIARLGDDDGGSTLPLSLVPFGNMSDTLWRASLELAEPSVRPPSETGRSALLWLEGAAAYEQVGRSSEDTPAAGVVALRDGGWIVMAEDSAQQHERHCLVFDVGPHGALSHAHAHADALAIDVSISGVPMLVDPGTGAYVGPSRNRFRSTAVHNTVTVDGADSSEQGTAFNWRTAAETQLEGVGTAVGASWAAAEHTGYLRLADPVRHHRTILRIDRHYWIMFDTLSARGTHTVQLTMQAAPGAVVIAGDSHRFGVNAIGAAMYLAFDPKLSCNIEQRAVSPAYGLELPASALVASASIAVSTTFCTAFGALSECGSSLSVHAAANPSAWQITHAGGTDFVARPSGDAISFGGATFNGTALAILNSDAPHTVIAAGAGTLHLDGRSFSLGADDIRVARRAANATWLMEF